MTRTSRFGPFLIGVAILAVGVVGLLLLVSLRPDPPREERLQLAPVVQTVAAEPVEGNITISGSGSVLPRRQVGLSAEVAGRIIDLSPRFVAGGRFEAGEMLVQIDTTDYVNAVAMARAEWTARRVEAIMAREEAAVARQEWERLQQREPEMETPQGGELGVMAFREPQVAMADAAVAAARARLDDALTRLERTRIRAPFDGQVVQQQADLGQVVGPGVPLARFQSTDVAEIPVALRQEEVDLLGPSAGRGARVRLVDPARDSGAGWEGRVLRSEGMIDQATRTVRVVVGVDDPLNRVPPLLTGAFVRAEITGREATGAVRIPRQALREEDRVWVQEADRLSIRTVRVLADDDQHVLIAEGLAPGDAVIISSLSVVTEGMLIRAADAR
ncbi:MAG: efflux RND transporter periplasmic adaptor subunit [Bacteroidetes bacterium]|nr:efflux RND transporter periplasmic adaptor subunit [Bacteroidota bacterium]